MQVSNFNQLTFLTSQIESQIQQIMDFSTTFLRDPSVTKFNGLSLFGDPYERMQTRYEVQEKLLLQSGVPNNTWPAQYAVFSQYNKDVISNINPSIKYSDSYLRKYMTPQWIHRKSASSHEDDAFYWYITDSIDKYSKLGVSNIIIEANFKDDNVKNMLDKFKASGRGDPFLYYEENDPIYNHSPNKSLVQDLRYYLDNQLKNDTLNQTVKLQDKKYLVTAVKLTQLNWYLVDYVPLEQILKPISFTRDLFYISLTLLLVIGFSASVLLYRHVQRPIKMLIRGVQSVRQGNFTELISTNERNEFSFLFHRFNEMSQQIEELIDNVLDEKLRTREAILKQLQAQINPHFLYNCLGFIINMAQLKDERAVVSMAYNLSAYYRYTTRLEQQTASVQEEMQLIINYLDIQTLRNGRIHYFIDIPEDMMSYRIPRLLLQPIVENAVIHGVGKSYKSGEIRISGQIADDKFTLFIDDDGEGLLPDEMMELNNKLSKSRQDDIGCGLWNVNQRIVHQFGESSSLKLYPSPLGGLRAVLIWKLQPLQNIKTDQNEKGI
jgi:two-component system sensor histidine kinase YesM